MSSKQPAASARRSTDAIELVVTDLDGTLWDEVGIVHARALAALEELAAAGVSVLAATARRLPGALEMMQSAGISLPVVALDGCIGVDRTSVVFHQRSFTASEASSVLSTLSDSGLEPCLNVVSAGGTVLIGESPASHPGHLDEISPWARTIDLNAALDGHAVMSFLVCGCKYEHAVKAARRLQDTTSVSVSVSRDLAYGNYALSVRPAGTDKWSGVTAYCRHVGLDARRVLAIGDGENDRPLLEAAALSCAPSDASPSILDCVDHITGETGSGGWADILSLL